MRKHLWAGVAAFVALASPIKSQAATVSFDFAGAGVSGELVLTVEPATKQGTLPSMPANSVNPQGSYTVTHVSGTFSDSNASIANKAVVDVEGLNRTAPEKTNTLAPYDFSLLPVFLGVNDGHGHISPGLHYDNLYYPGGSPQTANDYLPHGGVFDIYGLAFDLANGDVVNLWSGGPAYASYGVAVTDRVNVLDYVPTGIAAVPLPGTAPTLGLAILALGVGGLARRHKGSAAA